MDVRRVFAGQCQRVQRADPIQTRRFVCHDHDRSPPEGRCQQRYHREAGVRIPASAQPSRIPLCGGRCPGSCPGEIMVGEEIEAVQIPAMLVVRLIARGCVLPHRGLYTVLPSARRGARRAPARGAAWTFR
jgi:hypothetical protein